jgi:hypothetical protein
VPHICHVACRWACTARRRHASHYKRELLARLNICVVNEEGVLMRHYESYGSYARRRQQREAYAARYAAEQRRAKAAQAQKSAAAQAKQRKLDAMTSEERRAYAWQQVGKGVLGIIAFGVLLWVWMSAIGTIGHPGWLG